MDDVPTAEAKPTRWFTERSLEQRQDYAQRFVRIQAEGNDIDGEARLIDAMATPGSAILDAGCGAGRITHALTQRGHRVIGVDADPLLIEAGREQHPGADLRVLNLVDLSPDLGGPFDLIVCTGNVMPFVEPGTEPTIVAGMASVLAPGGRVVFGFHIDRAYPLASLDEHAAAVGWRLEHRFGTWNLDPFTSGSDWAVSVFRG
ncbi:class I SAM-dependent methyltransferase [Nocardioides sp. AE5]|uniref:class I SAM-dependent methyltransferase n=1 Tax=Nocardioides sp. AE5 TaxID=2962573 RepID=UPI0028817997|nr:class I SAM-dependent methyltransferase [Nocardioides sp. AE5]MDT0202335.1 class I SAM-dependent methyltransferase [Nocardioides sp. AE5]